MTLGMLARYGDGGRSPYAELEGGSVEKAEGKVEEKEVPT